MYTKAAFILYKINIYQQFFKEYYCDGKAEFLAAISLQCHMILQKSF